jgi:nucleotide-binding universal stress UspA family protein
MPKFERILFPVDFSERSKAAAPFVLSMAQRYKSRVVAMHVLQPPPPLYAGVNTVYPEVYDFEGISADLRAELQKFTDAELPKVDVVCIVETGDPAAVITEYAENEKVDLIAMPTHGYGTFRRALLGSVTAKVLHDANVPVWTAAHAPEPSHRAHPKPRQILCALDLRPDSPRTLEFAIELAGEADATVEVVYAAPEGEVDPVHSAERMQALLVGAARGEKVKVQEEAERSDVAVAVNAGSVAHMVRAMALAKRSDLVVIGRGEIHHTFGRLRANAYSIVREAPCPVLSV